jgi:hypothetical protein
MRVRLLACVILALTLIGTAQAPITAAQDTSPRYLYALLLYAVPPRAASSIIVVGPFVPSACKSKELPRIQASQENTMPAGTSLLYAWCVPEKDLAPHLERCTLGYDEPVPKSALARIKVYTCAPRPTEDAPPDAEEYYAVGQLYCEEPRSTVTVEGPVNAALCGKLIDVMKPSPLICAAFCATKERYMRMLSEIPYPCTETANGPVVQSVVRAPGARTHVYSCSPPEHK